MADFEIDQNIDPMDQLLQALMMLPGVGASMGPAEAAQEEVAGAEEIAEAEEEIAEAEEMVFRRCAWRLLHSLCKLDRLCN